MFFVFFLFVLIVETELCLYKVSIKEKKTVDNNVTIYICIYSYESLRKNYRRYQSLSVVIGDIISAHGKRNMSKRNARNNIIIPVVAPVTCVVTQRAARRDESVRVENAREQIYYIIPNAAYQ